MSLELIVGILIILLIATLVYAIKTAPLGYEDENGFHYTNKGVQNGNDNGDSFNGNARSNNNTVCDRPFEDGKGDKVGKGKRAIKGRIKSKRNL